MSDEMNELQSEQAAGRSPGARVVSWLVAGAVLLLVLLGFMHVFAPAIGPDEDSPSGHPQSACIACHIVTSSAEGDPE